MVPLIKWIWLLSAAVYVAGEEIQVNTQLHTHVVSERFLSLTIDPEQLFTSTPFDKRTMNMARALSPLFVRLGGPSTERINFSEDMGYNMTVTKEIWWSVAKFARDSGCDLVVSLPAMRRLNGVWDSSTALHIVSLSHDIRAPIVWQLGYDSGDMVYGDEIGRDLVRLRKILDSFSGYRGGPVLPPGLDPDGTDFIKDLLQQAGDSASALPIHLNLSGLKPDRAVDEISRALLQLEEEIHIRDNLLKMGGPSRPIWIAETTSGSADLTDAAAWIVKLGSAARLGVQVVMKQPNPISFYKPTPDYWVSVLYKNLVGRYVLDTKIVPSHRNGLYIYAHCTKETDVSNSILDSVWRYEKGAMTMFGANLSPKSVQLNLRSISVKEEVVHIYILTKPEGQENTFFNGQKLGLSSSGELPVLSPKARRATRSPSVLVPAHSVFFIVLPNIKLYTCMASPFSNSVGEIAKQLLPPITTVTESPTSSSLSRDEATERYVAYQRTKVKQPHSHQHTQDNLDLNSKIMREFNKMVSRLGLAGLATGAHHSSRTNPPIQDDHMKYAFFNDNSWLRRLGDVAQAELEEITRRERALIPEENDEERLRKYALLAKAIYGQNTDPELLSHLVSLPRSKRDIDINETADVDSHINESFKHIHDFIRNYASENGKDLDPAMLGAPIGVEPLEDYLKDMSNIEVGVYNSNKDENKRTKRETESTLELPNPDITDEIQELSQDQNENKSQEKRGIPQNVNNHMPLPIGQQMMFPSLPDFSNPQGQTYDYYPQQTINNNNNLRQDDYSPYMNGINNVPDKSLNYGNEMQPERVIVYNDGPYQYKTIPPQVLDHEAIKNFVSKAENIYESRGADHHGMQRNPIIPAEIPMEEPAIEESITEHQPSTSLHEQQILEDHKPLPSDIVGSQSIGPYSFGLGNVLGYQAKMDALKELLDKNQLPYFDLNTVSLPTLDTLPELPQFEDLIGSQQTLPDLDSLIAKPEMPTFDSLIDKNKEAVAAIEGLMGNNIHALDSALNSLPKFPKFEDLPPLPDIKSFGTGMISDQTKRDTDPALNPYSSANLMKLLETFNIKPVELPEDHPLSSTMLEKRQRLDDLRNQLRDSHEKFKQSIASITPTKEQTALLSSFGDESLGEKMSSMFSQMNTALQPKTRLRRGISLLPLDEDYGNELIDEDNYNTIDSIKDNRVITPEEDYVTGDGTSSYTLPPISMDELIEEEFKPIMYYKEYTWPLFLRPRISDLSLAGTGPVIPQLTELLAHESRSNIRVKRNENQILSNCIVKDVDSPLPDKLKIEVDETFKQYNPTLRTLAEEYTKKDKLEEFGTTSPETIPNEEDQLVEEDDDDDDWVSTAERVSPPLDPKRKTRRRIHRHTNPKQEQSIIGSFLEEIPKIIELLKSLADPELRRAVQKKLSQRPSYPQIE